MLYREMDEITLKEMTKELCRELFRGYEYDPMLILKSKISRTEKALRLCLTAG